MQDLTLVIDLEWTKGDGGTYLGEQRTGVILKGALNEVFAESLSKIRFLSSGKVGGASLAFLGFRKFFLHCPRRCPHMGLRVPFFSY